MATVPNDPDWRKATRMVDDAPALGFACYEGRAEGSKWVGTHVGVVGTREDAEAWLSGADVKPQGIWPIAA